MRERLELAEILLSESGNKPTARVWYYRMDNEPLVKKIIKFPINYAEIEVRKFLRNSGITYPITLWPGFSKEPPIIHKNITEDIEILDEETKWPEINEVYERIPKHDIENWFIRFTKGDRFGMNYNATQRGHFDPVGIYAYPLNWFYNKMKGSYYGTDRPGVYVFRVDLNAPGVYFANAIPNNLLNLLKASLLHYGKTLKNGYYASALERWSLKPWYEKPSWFRNFTDACNVTDNLITQGYLTKLLLNNNIQAIYDNGESIINSAEPHQMLVLNPKLCTNLTTIVLKQHNSEVEKRAKQLLNGIVDNKIDLKRMNPESILLLCKYNLLHPNIATDTVITKAIAKYIIETKKAPNGLLDGIVTSNIRLLLAILIREIVANNKFTVKNYINSGLVEQDDGDYMLKAIRKYGIDNMPYDKQIEFSKLNDILEVR
jgi:hypothetical protein